MDPVPARPVVRDDHGGGVFALFYPLHNLACPPITATKGEMVVKRMMRNKSILFRWERRLPAPPPTLVFCRECKLGFVAARGHVVIVECVHGTWSRSPDPKIVAAQRLGTNVASCDLCGRTYRHKDTWEYVGENPSFFETLSYCGSRCRERARRMSQLA